MRFGRRASFHARRCAVIAQTVDSRLPLDALGQTLQFPPVQPIAPVLFVVQVLFLPTPFSHIVTRAHSPEIETRLSSTHWVAPDQLYATPRIPAAVADCSLIGTTCCLACGGGLAPCPSCCRLGSVPIIAPPFGRQLYGGLSCLQAAPVGWTLSPPSVRSNTCWDPRVLGYPINVAG
mmetsp:Transcript_8238/g.25643  ORF Transcript_8238/g.25643 Transcript_8238/m.25643 type:complete len:177 (-) Transcript_8238:835-1365(-)